MEKLNQCQVAQESGWVRLICGDASKWEGQADLVLSTPYAPLPVCLHGKPTIIVHKNSKSRRKQIEQWICSGVSLIGGYADVAVYVANVAPVAMNFDDIEDGGFFQLELPLRLLRQYGRPGMTVWDGFMGRGTVGKACQMLGMNFIGIDIDPKRVELARRYIGAAT